MFPPHELDPPDGLRDFLDDDTLLPRPDDLDSLADDLGDALPEMDLDDSSD